MANAGFPQPGTEFSRGHLPKQAAPRSFPPLPAQADTLPRETPRTLRSPPPPTLAVTTKAITITHDNLAAQDWFQTLPLQRLQALLTLFPKSFSPFPHGTSMLSVLSPYLALDEIYHPLALQSQGT